MPTFCNTLKTSVLNRPLNLLQLAENACPDYREAGDGVMMIWNSMKPAKQLLRITIKLFIQADKEARRFRANVRHRNDKFFLSD
jgi:hypothetical protein